MKKQVVSLLFGALILLPVTSFGEEKEVELTAEIPSTYTLTIPATTKVIPANQEITDLGSVKVEGSLAPNQAVNVTTTKTALTHKSSNLTIPFTLISAQSSEWTQESWNESEAADAKAIPLKVKITPADWRAAKPGQYAGKIVFSSEIAAID